MTEQDQARDNRRLRILYLVFNRTGRGTYWRALGFGDELAHMGHHVTLMSAGPQSSETTTTRAGGSLTQVQLPDLHRGSGYDPLHALRRVRWLRQEQRGATFDLVHLFETRPVNVLPGLTLRRQYGVPMFTDWCDWFGRGGSVEERKDPLLRFLLRPLETFFEERYRKRALGTTVINTFLMQKALDLGISPRTMLLLPNGANVQEIMPQPHVEVRRRLGLAPERTYLAYTGSIFEQDAQLMARAFDLLSAQNPELLLLMIGYCNISLKALVRQPDRVVETGVVSYEHLADYVAAADVGWLPLTPSGANLGRFPMKAHDFIAAGRPLMVTDAGDLGSFVTTFDIGWVADATPQAQAQALSALLQQPALVAEMGSRARRVAVEERAWPVVTEKLAAFYDERLEQMSKSAEHKH